MRLCLREIELAVGRAWPTHWILLLEPLPGAGVMDACGIWHGARGGKRLGASAGRMNSTRLAGFLW